MLDSILDFLRRSLFHFLDTRGSTRVIMVMATQPSIVIGECRLPVLRVGLEVLGRGVSAIRHDKVIERPILSETPWQSQRQVSTRRRLENLTTLANGMVRTEVLRQLVCGRCAQRTSSKR